MGGFEQQRENRVQNICTLKIQKTVNTRCAQISNFQHIPELSWHIPPEEIDGWVDGWEGDWGRREDL
jgi:hypothetical protein